MKKRKTATHVFWCNEKSKETGDCWTSCLPAGYLCYAISGNNFIVNDKNFLVLLHRAKILIGRSYLSENKSMKLNFMVYRVLFLGVVELVVLVNEFCWCFWKVEKKCQDFLRSVTKTLQAMTQLKHWFSEHVEVYLCPSEMSYVPEALGHLRSWFSRKQSQDH